MWRNTKSTFFPVKQTPGIHKTHTRMQHTHDKPGRLYMKVTKNTKKKTPKKVGE